jgi:hypothetical protein
MGDPANVAGFVRLTVLLVGPISGGWPGFGQEMLRTMALLPGVVSLGPTTSHSGITGTRLLHRTAGESLNPQPGAVASKWSGPTVVLDAQTGALLEARNFDIPVLQTAAQHFVGSLLGTSWTPKAPATGLPPNGSTRWLPRVSSGKSALPSWANTFHIIEAVAKATTTHPQVVHRREPVPRSAKPSPPETSAAQNFNVQRPRPDHLRHHHCGDGGPCRRSSSPR